MIRRGFLHTLSLLNRHLNAPLTRPRAITVTLNNRRGTTLLVLRHRTNTPRARHLTRNQTNSTLPASKRKNCVTQENGHNLSRPINEYNEIERGPRPNRDLLRLLNNRLSNVGMIIHVRINKTIRNRGVEGNNTPSIFTNLNRTIKSNGMTYPNKNTTVMRRVNRRAIRRHQRTNVIFLVNNTPMTTRSYVYWMSLPPSKIRTRPTKDQFNNVITTMRDVTINHSNLHLRHLIQPTSKRFHHRNASRVFPPKRQSRNPNTLINRRGTLTILVKKQRNNTIQNKFQDHDTQREDEEDPLYQTRRHRYRPMANSQRRHTRRRRRNTGRGRYLFRHDFPSQANVFLNPICRPNEIGGHVFRPELRFASRGHCRGNIPS